MLLAILAAAAVAAPAEAPAAAPTPTVAPAVVEAPKAKPQAAEDELVCTYEATTGSRRKERVCHRKGAGSKETQDFLTHQGSRDVIAPPQGFGGPR
jgi:hypothetical protein